MIGGFREDWGIYSNRDSLHGNMTATDALGIAPQAKLFDIRIFKKQEFRKPLYLLYSMRMIGKFSNFIVMEPRKFFLIHGDL
ncbi:MULTISPECIES: hypothetical protein [Bacillus cereus group]|uniref:hypothetical protein n=1 Tax=Bacillus cereus group TaxID=86661 RepID=UPI000AF89BC5|nr:MULTISPECIES: hypothetical protein [Bacillus cereus group]MEB9559330.1 hypothetical protein [Bacillus cereus]MEC3014870.1 hypothetical protein [Bacillus cereus]